MPTRTLRALGRGALAPELRHAIAEILYGPGLLSDADLEGRATAAHEKLAAPIDHPDPRLLARGSALRVVAAPGLARAGLYLLGTVYYRPDARARVQGWTVSHETAHGLLDGLEHSHADVQRLALALLAPRAWVVAALRRSPIAAVKRRLIAGNPHAPAALLRLRIERVLLAAEAA